MTTGSGVIRDGIHRFRLRIYYEDTDAGGVVYYANYLKYAERARTEMLRRAGVAHAAIAETSAAAFAVRRCEIEFFRPARLDDEIWVVSRLLRFGGASAELEQTIGRDDTRLARLNVRLAFVSRQNRPARIPASLRDALTPLLKPGPGARRSEAPAQTAAPTHGG